MQISIPPKLRVMPDCEGPRTHTTIDACNVLDTRTRCVTRTFLGLAKPICSCLEHTHVWVINLCFGN